MIKRFGAETALLVIDAQRGVNVLDHWGGARGRRNNPEAESRIAELLDEFRRIGRRVFYTQHDSREPRSLGSMCRCRGNRSAAELEG